jgi:hypothetical protein
MERLLMRYKMAIKGLARPGSFESKKNGQKGDLK